MTTFKEIRGTDILALSSDPSNPELGQIWYNSSSGTLKGYLFATVNAWSAGGNLNTARTAAGGSGTATAALTFGGVTSVNLNSTESYNGTSWTTLPATMGTARRALGSFGTQTASIAAGGVSTGATNLTESYNGSTWSPVGNMNASTYYVTAVGTQTAGLAFARTPATGATESWNGSSWTNVNSMVSSRSQAAGAGTQTAALVFGGAPNLTTTESWNGSSWTSVNSLNTGRGDLGGLGTQSLALAFGGQSPFRTATELWNGTSWTSNPTGLANARIEIASAGTQTSGLAIGGGQGGPAYYNYTELWTGQANQTKTITVS
jgi:hypothetical protein